MNLAWIVSGEGPGHARNVHAPDRARLKREGFSQYELLWAGTDGSTRSAPVHAQRVPGLQELHDAADAIFGAGGSGKVRLVDVNGNDVRIDDA